jgi:adenylate cyclase
MNQALMKRLLVSTALALAVGALLTAAYHRQFFAAAQVQSTDFLFASRSGEQSQTTVIVGIDQRSYRELLPEYGPLVNWPRSLYATVLDTLREAGARVVVFDIFFDAPKPEDPGLITAMRRAGNVIVPLEAQGPKTLHPRPGVAQEFEIFVSPTASVLSAAVAKGTVNVTTDRDTVVRSIPLLLEANGDVHPALALTTVAQFIRRPTVLDADATDDTVYGAGRAIPLINHGRMLINFLGPPSSPERDGTFTILPFVDVLKGSFKPDIVRDKIVLLGLTIRGVDEFATPTTAETRMWGVELQANIVETILAERYLVPISASTTTILVCAAALIGTWLAALLRPIRAAMGLLGLLILYLLASGVLFDQGTLLNLIYPPGALALGFAVSQVYRLLFEQAQQQMMRDVMARYLSPSVSQWILKRPERLTLGGETRTMTAFFCDLRGFTTLSQAMDPQALVSLLNDYMSAMTEIVFRHDGVLDKYIGDEIMAFWNAPMDQLDHANRACATALDMVQRLHELREQWKVRGSPQLDLGIGINTGPMVVGNMGSRDRLAYTVLGDAVNIASRLQGVNKDYGTRVLVSEATKRAAGDSFVYRFLDHVQVKGRTEPLAVYEVVAYKCKVDPSTDGMLEKYARGIELYQARQWAEAGDLFRELLASHPGDGPSELYLRRTREFAVTPPPPDWSGVTVMKTK